MDQGITERERYLMEFAFGAGAEIPYRAVDEVRDLLDDTISDQGHKTWELLVHEAPKDARLASLEAFAEAVRWWHEETDRPSLFLHDESDILPNHRLGAIIAKLDGKE